MKFQQLVLLWIITIDSANAKGRNFVCQQYMDTILLSAALQTHFLDLAVVAYCCVRGHNRAALELVQRTRNENSVQE